MEIHLQLIIDVSGRGAWLCALFGFSFIIMFWFFYDSETTA